MPSKISLSTLLLCLIFSTISNAQLIRSDTIYFETDQFLITKYERGKIVSIGSFMDSVMVRNISIYAYCDDEGSKIYNESLSLKRAKYISEIIKNNENSKSIPVEYNGQGEIALNNDSSMDIIQQRKHNRKAIISIEYEWKEIEIISTLIVDTLELITDSLPNSIDILNDLAVGDVVVLDNILFVGGASLFLKESYPALNDLAQTLDKYPNYQILILGHVCCTPNGKDGLDYNTRKHNLSETRAKAVYDFLINKGISANRLKYKGLKGKFPTGREDKYDRRVEIEITGIIKDKD